MSTNRNGIDLAVNWFTEQLVQQSVTWFQFSN